MRATPMFLRSLLPLLLVVGCAAAVPAADAATAGSGRLASETRAVSDFDAIAISGSMKLEVRQTGRESLTLTGDDNVLPLIETVVEGSGSSRTLVIRPKRGESWRARGDVKAVVEVVRLTAVHSSGAGDVLVDGLKTPQLKLSIAGSGDARVQGLTSEALELRIAGSGGVRAQGSSRQVKLAIAGSGDAALADLTADDVNVSIAGSGDATVTANRSLSATVAGSGDVRYRGAATTLRTSMAGSGRVSKLD